MSGLQETPEWVQPVNISQRPERPRPPTGYGPQPCPIPFDMRLRMEHASPIRYGIQAPDFPISNSPYQSPYILPIPSFEDSQRRSPLAYSTPARSFNEPNSMGLMTPIAEESLQNDRSAGSPVPAWAQPAGTPGLPQYVPNPQDFLPRRPPPQPLMRTPGAIPIDNNWTMFDYASMDECGFGLDPMAGRNPASPFNENMNPSFLEPPPTPHTPEALRRWDRKNIATYNPYIITMADAQTDIRRHPGRIWNRRRQNLPPLPFPTRDDLGYIGMYSGPRYGMQPSQNVMTPESPYRQLSYLENVRPDRMGNLIPPERQLAPGEGFVYPGQSPYTPPHLNRFIPRGIPYFLDAVLPLTPRTPDSDVGANRNMTQAGPLNPYLSELDQSSGFLPQDYSMPGNTPYMNTPPSWSPRIIGGRAISTAMTNPPNRFVRRNVQVGGPEASPIPMVRDSPFYRSMSPAGGGLLNQAIVGDYPSISAGTGGTVGTYDRMGSRTNEGTSLIPGREAESVALIANTVLRMRLPEILGDMLSNGTFRVCGTADGRACIESGSTGSGSESGYAADKSSSPST